MKNSLNSVSKERKGVLEALDSNIHFENGKLLLNTPDIATLSEMTQTLQPCRTLCYDIESVHCRVNAVDDYKQFSCACCLFVEVNEHLSVVIDGIILTLFTVVQK